MQALSKTITKDLSINQLKRNQGAVNEKLIGWWGEDYTKPATECVKKAKISYMQYVACENVLGITRVIFS